MQENVTTYKHTLGRWLIRGKLFRIFTEESGTITSTVSSPEKFLVSVKKYKEV
jgi:hypothetical protein